jgi:hypothetical protein
MNGWRSVIDLQTSQKKIVALVLLLQHQCYTPSGGSRSEQPLAVSQLFSSNIETNDERINMRWLVFLSLFAFFHHFLGRTVAFSERGFDKNPTCTHSRIKARTMTLQAVSTAKQNLLDSLDDPTGFNSATSERTKLVEELTKTNTTPKPGSINGFAQFAEGTWRIVYAPHIFTMGSLAGGSFDPVYYIMKPGRIMTSHARYSFPLVGSGWLSVSGTYGSEDEDRTCRVDFDKAWVMFDNNRSDANKPVA